MIKSNKLKNFWALIPNNHKKKTPIIFLLILIGMFFEVFGIGILFPLVIGFLDIQEIRNIIDENSQLLSELIKDIPNESLIYLGLLSLVSLYILKTGYLAFLSFYQNDYLTRVGSDLSNIFYKKIFKQDYIYFLNKNSPKVINLFQLELNHFLTYLAAIFFVLTEFSLVLAILIALIIVEPWGAIIVSSILGFMSYVFYYLLKKRLTLYGLNREKADVLLSKNILESFHAIKEIKLYNHLKYFNNIHKVNTVKRAVLERNLLFFGQIPRLYLELIAVVGMIVFIIILLWQDKNSSQLISVLTVFVAATFRMIPSLNRVLNGVQSIRYHQASIDVLYNEYNSLSDKRFKDLNYPLDFKIKNSIILDNISFAYSNKEKKILNNLNLKIVIGNTIGIIGGSGSGKTTFLDVLIGLLTPQKGKLIIDGLVVNRKSILEWQKKIGYVSQLISLTDDSIKKNIAFGIEEKEIDNDKLNDCISKAQLNDLINNLDEGVETRIGERGVQLSGGQRQRIGIARALYNNPEVLVFDEATSALDESTEKQFMSAIERFKGKKTIVIVTHRLSTLRFCDKVYNLENGELILNKNYKHGLL